jgi:uncharacterized protein
MTEATFRFYQQLNSFLPREWRQRDHRCRCARAATAKHMIEALGVPHTEVGLVLVNGEPASLGRLLADGDRVAVYPPLLGLAIGELPAGPLRFVADAHLGGLARLLRMAGFDTLYDNHYHDDAIEAAAAREQRIVLTRDRDLLKRRSIERGAYLHAQQAAPQFRDIVERYGLAEHMQPFSLCLRCNVPLQAVDKALVAERLPPKVRAAHQQFQQCPECRGVFWQGSHWRRMCELLAPYRTALDAGPLT